VHGDGGEEPLATRVKRDELRLDVDGTNPMWRLLRIPCRPTSHGGGGSTHPVSNICSLAVVANCLCLRGLGSGRTIRSMARDWRSLLFIHKYEKKRNDLNEVYLECTRCGRQVFTSGVIQFVATIGEGSPSRYRAGRTAAAALVMP
jgi:hypothetical protein